MHQMELIRLEDLEPLPLRARVRSALSVCFSLFKISQMSHLSSAAEVLTSLGRRSQRTHN
jgi:hypothetical protein